MASPYFDSVALTTAAEQMITRGATSRHMIEHVPGVNGAYAQTHGLGEQMFELTGIRETAAAYAATSTALAQLRYDVRTDRLALLNTVAPFVDPSSTTWTNSLLVEYSVGPPFYFRKDTAGDYFCGGRVHIVVISLEGQP